MEQREPRSELVRVALRLQEALEEIGRPYCLIGGVAVQRWGEPRATRDVDAMVFTDLRDELGVIHDLISRFELRRPDAATFAMMSRVLLMLDPRHQTGIDVALGAFEYDRKAADRATACDYEPGFALRTCSAEDLIVYKAFANRDIDWHDIKGILIRQQGKLDLRLVGEELPPLVALKEEPEILARWEALKRRYP